MIMHRHCWLCAGSVTLADDGSIQINTIQNMSGCSSIMAAETVLYMQCCCHGFLTVITAIILPSISWSIVTGLDAAFFLTQKGIETSGINHPAKCNIWTQLWWQTIKGRQFISIAIYDTISKKTNMLWAWLRKASEVYRRKVGIVIHGLSALMRHLNTKRMILKLLIVSSCCEHYKTMDLGVALLYASGLFDNLTTLVLMSY